ncbi:MAG: tyrosine--tRNA ligase [Planctomycetaceae bacterium]|jgi:tyrosyl-tRNA synthetase|nr:tyrosine--tRNA ligase [Planctomycetaceae bacterium]MBT6460465.1 tyrosine--tRNA ligase [Planctomycetaceae bacterium]MBT6918588.1 tyrosine--tRNA ligase [Planctomycetaceae bacterium]
MPQNLLNEFTERGLVHQTTDTDAIHDWLTTPRRRIYAGFDPTADSLHVGHLVAIILLRRVALAGHEPIALIGGATGMIGDPSGRSEERNLLSHETLNANITAVGEQIKGLLESTNQTIHIVNNADWMRGVSYLEFLRDVGKHVPLSQMLGKDSVKSRLDREGGLSYTEFSYMLLQSWDFVHLADKYDCHVQIGGSDQWGNITAGIELGRRLRSLNLHGITCPLLTKADGSKMGKTASGAVWLDPSRTSPYRFYQYWMNLSDGDAQTCLLRLTEMSLEECQATLQEQAENPGGRASQRRLAEELTQLVHGNSGLQTAKQATAAFFGAAIDNLTDEALTEIFADVPSHQFSLATLNGEGLPLIEVMSSTKLAASRSAARRTIEQGGAYINNIRVSDSSYHITSEDLAGRTALVLRSGKKSYALARFQ